MFINFPRVQLFIKKDKIIVLTETSRKRDQWRWWLCRVRDVVVRDDIVSGVFYVCHRSI